MPPKAVKPAAAAEPVPDLDLELVELEHFDPDNVLDEDADFEDELPAGEGEFSDEDPLEETSDGYSLDRPAELPQPDRARSSPNLPKVKSNAFKRMIR